MEPLVWILGGLLEHAENGNITLPLLIVVSVLIAPTLWGVYVRYFLLRKVEELYRARIEDKDKEITRLQRRVTNFERKK